MKKDELFLYGMLAAVFLILGFSIYSLASKPTLQNTPENFQQYENLRKASSDECGDLTDPENIQHLSHHAELKPCLDKVDSALRKQVLG